MKKAKPNDTFLYLPWKSGFQLDMEVVKKAIDARILLFLSKLQHLTLTIQPDCYKKRCEHKDLPTIHFSRLNLPPDLNQDDITNIKCSESVIEETVLSGETKEVTTQTFLLYSCTVPIPPDLREEYYAREHVTHSKITIGFPISKIAASIQEKFPVFAFLPIEDSIRLPFLVNCDWILVTSRNSIRESERWNIHLRKYVAAFFIMIIANDEKIKQHLGLYLPKKAVGSNLDWWNLLIEDIDDFFKRNQQAIIKGTFLPNSKVTDLVPKDLLETCCNISIMDCEENSLLYDHLKSKIEILSSKQILNCFESSEFGNFPKNEKWWPSMFTLLSQDLISTPSIKELAKTQPIFLPRGQNGTLILDNF